MKINCKCGRVLKVSSELAGKKVKCKACGQKYRLPPLEQADPTIQMNGWKDTPKTSDGEEQAHNPNDVGAVALGESLSFFWIFASVIITTVMISAGCFGARYVLKTLVHEDKVKEYANYIYLGMYWGPTLAFVISGWIVARFSPGRTIAEPAVGASLAMVIFTGAMLTPETGLQAALQVGDNVNTLATGNVVLKLNLFLLATFNAACLSCAGAYFGEVAQERTAV